MRAPLGTLGLVLAGLAGLAGCAPSPGAAGVAPSSDDAGAMEAGVGPNTPCYTDATGAAVLADISPIMHQNESIVALAADEDAIYAVGEIAPIVFDSGVAMVLDLYRIPPRCGGALSSVGSFAARPSLTTPLVLVSGGRLYVAPGDAIYSLPADGGPVVVETPASQPGAFAVRGDLLYWLDRGGNVWSVVTGGDQPILQIAAATVPPDPSTVFGSPPGMAVDEANVYWTDERTDGGILAAPLDGGPIAVLATGEDSPTQLALAAGTLYWANAVPPTNTFPVASIRSLALPGGAAVTVTGTSAQPTNLTAVGASLYWIENEALRVTSPGQPPSTVRPQVGNGYAAPIAIGPRGVYWSPGTIVIGAPLP